MVNVQTMVLKLDGNLDMVTWCARIKENMYFLKEKDPISDCFRSYQKS